MAGRTGWWRWGRGLCAGLAVSAAFTVTTVARGAALPDAGPDAGAGVWAATGSMATARTWYTMTLLADGRVLVAGGVAGDRILAASEVFDPATGTFSPTGSMTVPRFAHAAALLGDGRVLVVGGRNTVTAELAAAEIYDPATGVFTPAGSTRTGHLHPEAIRLRSGKVLVVGGYTTSCDLYDPATGSFAPTGSLNTARGLFSATLLADGTVLAAGTYPWQSAAETYDPATGRWTVTGSMTAGRSEYPPGVLLDDGRVLLAGGTFGLTSELYLPATRTFARTGNMSHARHNYPLVKLADGTVLAAGGDPGGYVPTSVSEVYDPTAGTWRTTGDMVVRRFAHEGVRLLDGRVLVAGGTSPSGATASAELYSPPAGEVTALELSTSLLSGCLNASGRVTLSGPAPAGGLVVTLSSDSLHVTVPASIRVREGRISKRFPIATAAVDTLETATIRASAAGTALSAEITIRPMGVKVLLLSPNPVVGGATVSGIVALPCAAGPGDVTVSLTSAKPDLATPSPESLMVPAGTNFVPFDVTTTPVAVATRAAISATANGIGKSKTLLVTPAP